MADNNPKPSNTKTVNSDPQPVSNTNTKSPTPTPSNTPIATVVEPKPITPTAPPAEITPTAPPAEPTPTQTGAGAGAGAGTGTGAGTAVAEKPPSLFSIIALQLVLVVGILLALSASYFKQIFSNFASFRCNPLMMPFAGLFGYDASENFQFCLGNILQGRLGEAFSPIFKLLGSFGETLSTVINATLGLRKLFSNFFATVNGFISNVQTRIKMLMSAVQMSMLKMKELMGKVYGTMYAVIWMGTSGLTAGSNIANNDLVKFMMEFCFAPDTPIQLADGSWTTLASLHIGSTLSSLYDEKPVVTSLFEFDGSRTPMVRIGDVTVSAAHYVQCDGEWMEASDHPDAIPVAALPRLLCLNVTGHRFVIGRQGLVAADYDESESDDVVAATQALALCALNGGPSKEAAVDYSLGVSADVKVRMADDSWKRLDTIRIGDKVRGSGIVRGIVKEECEEVVETGCGPMAAGQVVFDGSDWKRATSLYAPYAPRKGTLILHQLITEQCSAIEVRKGGATLFIRDYREVPLPDMEDAYAASFIKSSAAVGTCATQAPTVHGSLATLSSNNTEPQGTA